jgi:diadenosine tetraphosphate (Ap4A) HIT family hydrolase
MNTQAGCELCDNLATPAWPLVWRDAQLRVVRVLDAPEFPGFYRVIWNAHVAEFSQLSTAERHHCMAVVAQVEAVLRAELAPIKINLAALGNMVPHLHWHVIARFDWDSHFPQPIWGTRQRMPEPSALQRLSAPLATLDERLRAALEAAFPPA